MPRIMAACARLSRSTPPRAPASISARMRADGRVQAAEDRLADQEVADVELDDLRHARDGGDGVEGEAVAGVHLEAGRGRGRARRARAGQLALAARSASSSSARSQ